jgi:hypothetical protein
LHLASQSSSFLFLDSSSFFNSISPIWGKTLFADGRHSNGF